MKRKPPLLDRPIRRRRSVSQEEMQLWHEAMQTPVKQETATPAKPEKPIRQERIAGAKPVWAQSSAGTGRTPASHLDKNTLIHLRRGRLAIDATLDLHGHTREMAHGALLRFIMQAHLRGLRCVLVITGKGQRSQHGGTLRELLPRWLNESPLRERIIAYDSAHLRHGGSGAWYIRIRKTRL